MVGGGTRTILFNDLVGSTALLVELGPERFEELLGEHDRLVMAAVAACDGEIVKHTGDGMMAAFAGASDGLSAGVAIQQAIERRNRDAAVSLAVRVGLSAGDAFNEGRRLFRGRARRGAPALRRRPALPLRTRFRRSSTR